MLELLTPRVKEELGPLCPDWFELLTSKASKKAGYEENVGTPALSRVEEDGFKSALENEATGSQTYSTPKVFRGQCRQLQNPTSQDQDLHTGQTGSESLLWVDTTPSVYGALTDGHAVSDLCSNQLSRDCFGDVMDTPRSTLPFSSRRICESLGAQMDPDVSWSSSLNTPPVMSPTVILTKKADSSYPVSCSGDKQVIFVRKLFPETSGILKPPSEEHEAPAQSERVSRSEKIECVGVASPNVTASLWKQKLPDAIRDAEVRHTVASVLDGAEEVLSVFFTSSSTSLQTGRASEGVWRKETSADIDALPASPTRADGTTCSTGVMQEVCKEPQGKHTQEVQSHGDCCTPAESGLVAPVCDVTQWTPVTFPDCATSQPHSERDADVHVDGAGQTVPGISLPETLSQCHEGHVVECSSLAHCDSALHRGKNIVSLEGTKEDKHLGPPLTVAEARKNGTEDSFITDMMQLNVRVPELKCHIDLVGGATGTSSPHRFSQQEEVAAHLPAAELPEGSVKGSAFVTSMRKPTRKFVYSLPSQPGHAAQTSQTCNRSLSVSPSFSGYSLTQKQSDIIKTCRDGEKCQAATNSLRCGNVYSEQEGVDKGTPSGSREESSPQLCAAFTEGPNTDAYDRTCIQETNDVSRAASSFTPLRQMDRNRPKDTTLGTLKPNGRNELTSDKPCVLAEGIIGQKTTKAVKESTQAIEHSDCSGSFSDAVKRMYSHRPDVGQRTAFSDVTEAHRIPDGVNTQHGKGGQLGIGFKTASEKVISLSFEAIQKAQILLDEATESNVTGMVTSDKNKFVKSQPYSAIQSKVLDTGRKPRGLQMTTNSPRNLNMTDRQPCKSSAINTVFLPRAVRQSSASTPGSFRTASNITIRVSSVNLERAKRLLDEVGGEDARPPASDIPNLKKDHKEEGRVREAAAPVSARHRPVEPCSQERLEDCSSLTASQKADVTELCSLLEEADSQFEFTQFKQVNANSGILDAISPEPRGNKEMDPDFLTGIDFDDSFNSPGDKQTDGERSAEVMEPDGGAAKCDFGHSGLEQGSKVVDVSSCGSYGAADKSTGESLKCPENARTFLVPGNNVNSENFGGFYTGHGVQMTVCMESLKRASSVFDGLELDGDMDIFAGKNSGYSEEKSSQLQNESIVKSTTEESTSEILCCFNKPKDQGKQETEGVSLRKSHAVASVSSKDCFDCDSDNVKKLQNGSKSESNSSEVTQSFLGFKTARGASVSVGEKSLRKAVALFADLDEERRGVNGSAMQSHTTIQKGIDTGGKTQGPLTSNGDLTPRSSESHIDNEFEVGTHHPGKNITNDLKVSDALGDSNTVCTGTDVTNECISQQHHLDVDDTVNKYVVLAHADTSKTNVTTKTYCGTTVKASVCLKKPCAKAPEYGISVVEYKTDLSCDFQREAGGGFRTASGKGVSVSAQALQRARDLFRDCSDSAGSERRADGKGERSSTDNGPEGGCFGLGFLSGKDVSVSVSPKGPVEAKAFVATKPDEGMKKAVSHGHPTSLERNQRGFSATCERRMPVFETALMPNNSLLKNSEEDTFNGAYTPKHTNGLGEKPHDSNCGFTTAGGKGVPVSIKALQEAMALFSDMESIPFCKSRAKAADVCETGRSNSCVNDAAEMNCGFSTAGGKRVSVSRKSLMKATALLEQCKGTEKMESEKCAGTVESTILSLEHQTAEQTADDGKGMCVSTKPNFTNVKGIPSSDFGMKAVREDIRREANSCLSGGGKMSCGFSTAGGKMVSVSRKSLMKARALLDQCDVTEEVESEKCNGRVKRTLDLDNTGAVDDQLAEHSAASSKEMPFSGKKMGKAKADIQQQHTNGALMDPLSSQQTATVLERQANMKQGNIPNHKGDISHKRGIDQEGTSKMVKTMLRAAPKPSSSLNLQHLEFSGCTDTQQHYLEQEAEACTRALLEDEEGNSRSAPDTSGKSPLAKRQSQCEEKHSEDGRTSGRKRVRVADCPPKDQPPLKRQLLVEFDRTSNGGNNSLLTPMKSSPNGTLKDRRIFKYSMTLQPNVTQPFSDNTVLAQRLRTDPGSSHQPRGGEHSKCSVFLPPFRKPSGPQAEKEKASRATGKTPRVFVPPFKNTHLKSSNSLGEITSQAQDGRRAPRQARSLADQNTFVPPDKCRSDPNPAVKIMPEHNFNTKELAAINELNSAVGGDLDTKGILTGLDRDALTPMPTSPPGSDVTSNTLMNLKHARDLQDMRIIKKKKQTIRPQPGNLYLAKTSGRIRLSLRSAFGGRCPVRHTQEELYKLGVHHGVSEISSENAESFCFHVGDFFKQEVVAAGSGVQLADGGWLIPDNKGTVGKEEFYRALCDTPGVDPKLITESWVYNHYRWVVWKRASMERSFPDMMGSRGLTPEQVLLQLKYRYDVEIDLSRRSALRKIMERDDAPAKTMILCICGVASMGSGRSKAAHSMDAKVDGDAGLVCVTDGWYAIKALLDAPLTAMLQKGHLAVGTKVVTQGAELIGSQDACTPLEAPTTLKLKISANSTRRARWDARLGFHLDPRPLQLCLSSLYSSGGVVGCVDVVVLRSYPVQWMEKKPGGVYVFRNGRAEEREARRHSDDKQKAVEILLVKVQAQFEKDEEVRKPKGKGRRLSRQEIEALQDGQGLHDAVESDPTGLETLLDERQLEMLRNYRQSLEQDRRAEIQRRLRQALEEAQKSEGACCDRDVSPVWKLCVCDWREPQRGSGYLLNVWRPSADLQTLLKEGSRYKVYHLSTSEGRRRSTSSVVQLTATKKTLFQNVQTSPVRLSKVFQPRACITFRAFLNPGFRAFGGEVDIVGYVIRISDANGPSPLVYLADEQLDCVAVRGSCSMVQLALDDVVKPRALLALSNLQLRCCSSSSPPVPVLYAGDLALVSANPKEPHLQEAVVRVRNAVQDCENFFRIAEEKFFGQVQSDFCSLPSPKGGGTTPKTPSWNVPQSRINKETSPSHLKVALPSWPQTPVDREPTQVPGSSADRDPKSIKRKRGLDYLSRIPSPPPLCPIGSTASPSLSKTFHPPRRSGTPQSTGRQRTPVTRRAPLPAEHEWVKDEELAMINTQALLGGLGTRDDTGVGGAIG